MSVSDPLQNLIQNFSGGSLQTFMRSKSRLFKPTGANLSTFDKDKFSGFQQVGEIEFGEKQNWDRLIVVSAKVDGDLGERSCRKAQFETARKILKTEQADAGIFAFHDAAGRFRFSLIYTLYEDAKLRFNHFRRFTYFIQPDAANKTFVQQVGGGSFESIDAIKTAFSVEAVSKEFYDEFKPKFDAIADSVLDQDGDKPTDSAAGDFALLFVIRILFLGFVQKRGWLGDDPQFISNLWKEYQQSGAKDEFYRRWLSPLFFSALNNCFNPAKTHPFSPKTMKAFQLAPYLNGSLFKEKEGYDDRGWLIPDAAVADFFNFLFQYNFTVEENKLYDEDLELNPEFLGIIFERLVNKADGAVYTPREEVDLMCRLSLVKWLEKNNETGIELRDLYELFFRELGAGDGDEDDQKTGSFSKKQGEEILQLLQNITVCDPAVGSGAFPVGMMQVLDETEHRLRGKLGLPDLENTIYERRQRIIRQTLYGVEVKEWAVWICQLRLWISLFIDAPEEKRHSQTPLLPSLDFKIRKGDSLVQMIGGQLMAVCDQRDIAHGLKKKIGELQEAKNNFFQNRTKMKAAMIRAMETALFRSILDEQITALKKALGTTAGRQKIDQLDLISGFNPAQQLKQKGLFEQQAEEQKQKIAELENEKRALNDDHPLIWNIEFAEIFAERGGFDLVIGNPPYVRNEAIADPYKRMEPGDYKALLSELVKKDFPASFGKNEQVSGKSDLYTYFYIRGLRLLNPSGLHTFICSNSWLDVGYGAWLQKFLLDNAPPLFIIDNHARRSFAEADVNTIISIIDAPRDSKVKKGNAQVREDNTKVRFVAFKRPFEEVVFTEHLLAIDQATAIQKNDSFRVFPIFSTELREAGMEYEDDKARKLKSGTYTGDKWGGKYLRAPDVFFSIMYKTGLVCPVCTTSGSIAEIQGYVHDNNTGEKFPKTHFIKTIKNIRKINLKKTDCIQYGVKNDGNSRTIATCLFPRTFGQDHLVLFNIDGVIGKEFYKVIAKGVSGLDLAGFLNSTFLILQRELFGLTNLGDGALKFSGDDVRKFLYPVAYSIPKRFNWASFGDRQIKSIFEECGIDPQSEIAIENQNPRPLPDRKELDSLIFDALELTAEERKEVYRAVCRLVWNRISKAKSV